MYADNKPHPYFYCVLQNFLNGNGIFIAPQSYILHINTILGKTMSHTLWTAVTYQKNEQPAAKIIFAV